MSSITSLIESAAEAIDARSWPGRLMLMLLRERFERTELAWDSINMSIWLSCVKCTSSPPRCAGSESGMSSVKESSNKSLRFSVMLSRPLSLLQKKQKGNIVVAIRDTEVITP